MGILIPIMLLIGGLTAWYGYYGLECFLNGGSLGRNPYTMPFTLLWEEFTWLLPGGWERKLRVARGDVELARTLPGWPHFLLTHVALPFGPLILFTATRWAS